MHFGLLTVNPVNPANYQLSAINYQLLIKDASPWSSLKTKERHHLRPERVIIYGLTRQKTMSFGQKNYELVLLTFPLFHHRNPSCFTTETHLISTQGIHSILYLRRNPMPTGR